MRPAGAAASLDCTLFIAPYTWTRSFFFFLKNTSQFCVPLFFLHCEQQEERRRRNININFACKHFLASFFLIEVETVLVSCLWTILFFRWKPSICNRYELPSSRLVSGQFRWDKNNLRSCTCVSQGLKCVCKDFLSDLDMRSSLLWLYFVFVWTTMMNTLDYTPAVYLFSSSKRLYSIFFIYSVKSSRRQIS